MHNFHKLFKVYLIIKRIGNSLSRINYLYKIELKDLEPLLGKIFSIKYRVLVYLWLDLELLVVNCWKTLPWWNLELKNKKEVLWWLIQIILRLPTWIDNFYSGKNISENQKVLQLQLQSVKWIQDSKDILKQGWIKFVKVQNKFSITNSSWIKLSLQML